MGQRKAQHTLYFCPMDQTPVPKEQRVPGDDCPFCGCALPRQGEKIEIGVSAPRSGPTSGTSETDDRLRLPVIYLGGFAGHKPRGGTFRQSIHEAWTLVLTPRRVEVHKKDNKALSQDFIVRSESWTKLKFVSFEDAGTKPNVAAIALVGVLGLSSTKASSLITIGYPDGEAMFLAWTPVYEFRQVIRVLTRKNPGAGEKLRLGPVEDDSAQPRTQSERNVVEELERAADLLERGHITEDDYAKIKADLMKDL